MNKLLPAWRLRLYGVLGSMLLVVLATQSDEFKCSDCHDEVKLTGSVHDEMLACADCHSDVKDEEHAADGAKPVDCASCHEDRKLAEHDIHLRLAGRIGDRKTATCATCHGGHQVQRAPTEAAQVELLCASCHNGKVQPPPSYHQPVFVANEDCLTCHDQQDHAGIVGQSVHRDFACADCHSYVARNLESHEDGVPVQEIATCATCHREIAKTHAESIHGIALAEAIDEAAKCWDCHSAHDIVPVKSANSPVAPANLADTCGACHANPDIIRKFGFAMSDIVEDFKRSVHGRLPEAGRTDGPNCAVCHGTHDIRNRVQPNSKISSFNVPDTCGECHEEIVAEYKQSIHWVLAKRGVSESPVCNDCHSEHAINPINSAEKRAEVRRLQNETCIRCHQDPVINRKFSLPLNRPSEYLDSYHGLAVMRGDEDAAMCIDCHGVHKILPKSHPESLVHADNVTATCATCHPGASATFAHSYAHNEIVDDSRRAEWWVRQVYVWLIILVIGGMVGHNLLILGYELREHRQRAKARISLKRFTSNEVAQHLALMLIFTLLAITGFALKYPNFPLFQLMASWGLSEPVRQGLHRGLGVALVVLGVYHVGYMLVTQSGRHLLRHMMLRLDDIRDAIHNLLFHARVSRKEPQYGHFNYIEKSEYWALVWGTIIMALTGLILWVPTLVGDWAPIWLIRVCEIIHFYEAVLATLAIMVWHLFFVIYHPKEYPMNLAWIDGTISLEAFREHYAKEYRQIASEYAEAKRQGGDEAKLSYDTRRFLQAIRRQGIDPDLLLEGDADPEKPAGH